MDYRDEFKTMIETIKINRETPPEEFNAEILPLIHFIQKNIPETLYKFRACTENNLDAFDKDEIWLSKASAFNDLHDSLLFFDKPAILEQARQIFSPENYQMIFETLKQAPPILDQSSFQNPAMLKIITDGLDRLDKQQFFSFMQQLMPNLDMFLDFCFGNLKNEIRNHVKTACLSGNINSPLMWAHYADNHKGFAIGYDFRGNNICQCANCKNRLCNSIKLTSIYPIIYSDDRFDATPYGKWYVEQYMKISLGMNTDTIFDDDFLFTKAALHKSNDWKYEDEWRIICSTPDLLTEQKDCYPIKKKPVAIYFGSQISDIYRKMLTQIADEKGIAKYQMYVEDYSSKYELNNKPL